MEPEDNEIPTEVLKELHSLGTEGFVESVGVSVAADMIDQGDPRAIPALLKWIQIDPTTQIESEQARLREGIWELGQFHAKQALPYLARIYDNEEAEVVVRTVAAKAIAKIHTDQSRLIIRRILQENLFSDSEKVRLAHALVLCDDDLGRSVLYNSYVLYFDALRNGAPKNGEVAAVLSETSDVKLLAKLSELRDAEPKGKPRSIISSLIQKMEWNTLSDQDLLRMAQDDRNDWQIEHRRLHAITMLGLQGDVKLLPQMEKLRESLIDNKKPLKGTKIILKDTIDKAIGEMKRRKWALSESLVR